MTFFDHIKILNHHAYFIHTFNDVIDKLKKFLKSEHNIDHLKNPDFFHESYESLGIDESRRIKDLHSSKGFVADSKRIFIIETKNITHEAQNSLLKMFEEPHEHSHFFIIMPSFESLLPTLRSRLNILNKKENDESTDEAEKFLKLSKKEKVDFVDALAKDISDEKATKSDAQRFLNSLETFLYKDGVEKNRVKLKAIIKVKDYMNDRSPSIKQLLEYIALV